MRRTASIAIAVVLALAMSPAPERARAQLEEPPPNVLVIVTDDQRHGLSVMPDTRRLFVEQGVRARQAFATTPVCCPSRASIMTGRYAHNHLVLSNSDAPYLIHETTLQSYLHGAGYRTGIYGKFLNQWDVTRPPPYFDEYGITTGAYYDGTWNVNGNVKTGPDLRDDVHAPAGAELHPQGRGKERRRALVPLPRHDRAAFVVRGGAKYEDARVPRWDGNPAVFERDLSGKPAYVREANCRLRCGQRIHAAQLRTLMSVDDLVGGVFDALADTGESRRTLAFFLSDNGYSWGEHRLGGKDAPYTNPARISLLARWPGHLPAGAERRDFTANIDVPPTVLDAVGISTPSEVPVDGRSLFDPAPQRDRLLLEHWCNKLRCRFWALPGLPTTSTSRTTVTTGASSGASTTTS